MIRTGGARHGIVVTEETVQAAEFDVPNLLATVFNTLDRLSAAASTSSPVYTSLQIVTECFPCLRWR